MRKKKYLHISLAIALGTCLYGGKIEAADHWSVWNQGDANNLVDGDRIVVNGSGGVVGAFGVYGNGSANFNVNADNITIINNTTQDGDGIRTNPGGTSDWINGNVKISIGNGWTIINNSVSGDGLNINGGTVDNLVKVGNKLTIETYQSATGTKEGSHGVRANFHGHIEIGNELNVTTYGDGSFALYAAHGSDSNAVKATDGSTITTGDDAKLLTKGNNAHVVVVGSDNGKVVIGNNAELNSEGNGSHAVVTYNTGTGKGTAKAAQVTIKKDAKITTEGLGAYAVYANSTDSRIFLDERAVIKTMGDGSHGLRAAKGKIEIGDGLDLTTAGAGSHATYSSAATGSIEFQGGATINATGSGSYVMFADAGKITSKLDTNGDVVSGGKFLINGNMTAANGGSIDLILGNGSIFVGSADENTGNIKLKMEAGSKWYVTADKYVDLTMEEGSILYLGTPQDQLDFALKNIANTGKMTVNGGTSWFQADVGSVSGDRLVVDNAIEGTSGKIAVQNLGASTTDGTEKLVLVEARNSGAGFTLSNAVEQGGYIYLLDSESDGATGTNWFLYGTRQGTSTGSASVNVFSGGYLLNYAETQTLLQRMGDLRQDTSDSGVWARAYGGKFTSSTDGFLSGFDMSYSGMQVGADKKIALKNKGNIYVGGMFGYSKGNLDYGVGSGSIDSKTLGAYGTYMAPTGFYADLVLKYGWMKNDFKVLDSAGDWVTGDDMSTDGLSASLEVGQRIHLDRKKKEGWYLEPQAQISMGHQSGGSFKASNGLQVDVDSYTSTLGRLGLNAGYEVKRGKNPINIYAKVSYVHEFDGDVGYRLNGSREQTSFGDSWWTYGLGVTAQINKKHNVYLDIERASGGQFNQPWSLNGGYRFNW